MPSILAARAILAILPITIAMVAMMAILLAMLAMTTILLATASNDYQYCQLSDMCATTAINCPGGSLFTAALPHSFGIIAVLAMNCPVTLFCQQTAKQQNSNTGKQSSPRPAQICIGQFLTTNAKVCNSGFNSAHGATVITLDPESSESQFESW